MLNKATDEANHPILHFLFLLPLDVVGEDLYARLGQDRDDLADSEVIVVPKTAQRARPLAHAFGHL